MAARAEADGGGERPAAITERGRIGIFDVHGAVADVLSRGLDPVGVKVWKARSLAEVDDLVHGGELDLLVVTMCLSSEAELPRLARLGEDPATPPVAVLTGCTPTSLAGRVLFPEAVAFLELPIAPGVLREELLTAMRRTERPPPPTIPGIVGRSPVMQEVLRNISTVAGSDSNVLLIGATGTGKELVARTIHDLSNRSGGPFVSVDCAGLPVGLLESELFGHVRGSFTGAHRSRRGLFEASRHGTVFLDEVDDAPEAVQVRLLRVLQERHVRRLGDSRHRSIDVRVVAASQRDLAKEVRAGRFREDLYYRLRVFEIQLPPLRERPGDLEALVAHRLEELGRSHPPTSAALRTLAHHRWPGNVRELRSVLEAAAVAAPTDEPIGLADLREDIRRAWIDDVLLDCDEDPLPERARSALREVLEEADGVRKKAAAILGISPTTLWRMMKRIGM